MKQLVVFIFLILVGTPNSFAYGYGHALLTKSTFAPNDKKPPGQVFTTCRIFEDKVELSFSCDGIVSRTTKPINFSGILNTVIDNASKPEVEETPDYTPGVEHVQYIANKIHADGRAEVVFLGGTGRYHLVNNSDAAKTLRIILDEHCKN